MMQLHTSARTATTDLALKLGASASGALVWPHGRRISVPLTTTLEARPWYLRVI